MAAFAVVLGSIAATVQLRLIAAARRSDVAIRLFELWDGLKPHRDLIRACVGQGRKITVPPAPEELAAYAAVGSFFEMVAVAYRQKGISGGTIMGFLGKRLFEFHDVFQDVIEERRRTRPTLLENYMWLLTELGRDP